MFKNLLRRNAASPVVSSDSIESTFLTSLDRLQKERLRLEQKLEQCQIELAFCRRSIAALEKGLESFNSQPEWQIKPLGEAIDELLVAPQDDQKDPRL